MGHYTDKIENVLSLHRCCLPVPFDGSYNPLFMIVHIIRDRQTCSSVLSLMSSVETYLSIGTEKGMVIMVILKLHGAATRSVALRCKFLIL